MQLQQSLSVQNQCAKNHKLSCTPLINREPNHEWNPVHNCYKENKIHRNATYKGCEGPLQGELQTTAQGNGKDTKRNNNILMDRKNQYAENGHSAQSNL